MTIRPITPEEKEAYNAVVTHPLQTYEWGEFREQTGLKVIRRGFFDGDKLISAFQLTIHKIPKTPWTIGYLPKGDMPTKELLDELRKIGREEKCIFIQLEPNIIVIPVKTGIQTSGSPIGVGDDKLKNLGLQPAAHPLFTKYTFILDLTKSEEELLKNMHPKARYNIKVAQKHSVEIIEDSSDEAFEAYLNLTKETTQRQGFFAHTENYHRLMWGELGIRNQELGIMEKKNKKNPDSLFMIHNSKADLTAHLLIARYRPMANDQRPMTLTAWILFVFKDTLYYPYGASSSEHREVMSSSLMMWEAIRFGKKLGLKKFDMWGALGPNPDPKDPWFGFHNFKEKYGPEHVEFIGSYDLVINPILYQGYKLADKLRWLMLRFKK